MNNLIRIGLIENNLKQSNLKYDDGKITREELDILIKQGNRRIKELRKEIQKGNYY